MADEPTTHCERWQDPVTKAFHFSGCVTFEDIQRIMKLSSNDSSTLDYAFDREADAARWLKGFVWLFTKLAFLARRNGS